MRNATGLLVGLILITVSGALFADQAVLHMEIGDPSRRTTEVPLILDGITDTSDGQLLTPAELVRRLAGTGILFIGEYHTNMDSHDVQLRVIQALHEAGREVLIGLEMFPYTEQDVLGRWSRGLLTEPGFLEIADWYANWGYHWRYYRDIFLFARDNGIALFAVNTPRPIVTAARKKGFENLSDAEAEALPPQGVAPVTDEQRQMFKAFFANDDKLHRAMTDDQLEGMYRAQTTWDATMGWNALKALQAHGGKNTIMVVLIGAGHVTFGLGSERQIAPHYDGKISTLIPVPVIDQDGAPISTVRASYANFLWGIPEQSEPLYPVMGVSLMGDLGAEPNQIIQVSDDSVGQRVGLQVGDVLLGFDGEPITSRVELLRKMAGYRWGDEALLKIRRDGEIETLTVSFRRKPPTAAK